MTSEREAEEAFELLLNEQKWVPGMPKLAGARPAFVSGFLAARAALPAPADQPTSQEALTDADIKRVHDTQACLPDLVGMKDQWPEILRFARAVIDADRKARQQEAMDARRYRWLRDKATIATVHIATPDGWKHYGIGADETVDAAIAKGERHEPR